MTAISAELGSAIEYADALDWLAAREPGAATAVIFDPPYAVGSPVRGWEDGVAGSVSGPLSFMQRTMSLCAQALRPGGIVIIFGDCKRLPDLMYAATTSGLRLSGCVAWVRLGPALAGCSGRAGPRSSSPRGGRRSPSTGQRSGTWSRPITTWSTRTNQRSAPTPVRSRERFSGTCSPGSAAAATWSSTRSPGRVLPGGDGEARPGPRLERPWLLPLPWVRPVRDRAGRLVPHHHAQAGPAAHSGRRPRGAAPRRIGVRAGPARPGGDQDVLPRRADRRRPSTALDRRATPGGPRSSPCQSRKRSSGSTSGCKVSARRSSSMSDVLLDAC